MRGVVLAALLWAVPALAAAAEDAVDRLGVALRLADMAAILRDEGRAHGRLLDEDMLNGSGGRYFADQVEAIYDPEEMVMALKAAIGAHMSDAEIEESLAYFGSEIGQRVIGLEITARAAYSLDDVKEMAVARYKALPESDPRHALVRAYVEANDLVERNVDGIHGTDYSFYLGLADGGAIERNDAAYLAGLLEEREALMAETEEWAMSFHLMAYHPLSPAEQQANIDFSRSAAGQAFNDAVFAGFDRMYEDIFYRLGRLVARAMEATDL